MSDATLYQLRFLLQMLLNVRNAIDTNNQEYRADIIASEAIGYLFSMIKEAEGTKS